jgi:hypothetical protein
MNNRMTAAIAIALPLILLACGGGAAPTHTAAGVPTQPPTATGAPTGTPATGPTNAPVGVDVCSLLSVGEASTAFGETLTGAVASTVETYSYCDYGADREIRTWINSDATTSSMYFATMKINDGEAVTGVGDEAWWSTDGFQPGLYFMKGGRLAYISGPQTGPEPAYITMGQLLASRM